MERTDPSIFKAYDIRGVYPSQINAEAVYRIARAYVEFLSASPSPFAKASEDRQSSLGAERRMRIAVGTDMRLCGEEFKNAVIAGLTDSGVNVIDLGLISTDQMYFAVVHLKADGGIIATASHNPKEFGGLKLMREKARPISGDSGIYQIRDLVLEHGAWSMEQKKGKVEKQEISEAYFKHIFSLFDTSKFKSLKIVANPNFGMAVESLKVLKQGLPVKFVEIINNKLDGSFPLAGGRPDPLRPENRAEIIAAIKKAKADLGVAWDGDADRCFFFDEHGQFVTPAYINALLSEYYLKKYPGAKVLHDTRVVRVIDFVINQNRGVSIATKAGHSFIKERMMKEEAVLGSETSGHYYFKDNFYMDNGLIPFLAVLDILSADLQKNANLLMPTENQITFSQLLKPLREKFFISEEINFEVNDKDAALHQLKEKYKDADLDETDGASFNYPIWRFNARKANTENLLRINVEAGSKKILEEKTSEVTNFISKLK